MSGERGKCRQQRSRRGNIEFQNLLPIAPLFKVSLLTVSDSLSAEEDENDPAKSVLLSSVSPSLFVVLGAVSASVILLTVVMAALYVR